LQKFELKKLSEPEIMEQYQVKISKMFVALENLNNTENKKKSFGKQ